MNRSRVSEREESAAEEEKQSVKSLRICGVTKKTAIIARITLFIFIVIIITSLLLLIHQQAEKDEVLMQHHHLDVIKKSDWTMKPLNGDNNSTSKSINKESIPVRVYVNASSTQACRTDSECIQLLRTIEKEPLALGVNFWISYDGTVFEDSGWTNSKRIFISFIANKTTSPSSESLKALDDLLGNGVIKGKLDRNYKIIANKNFFVLSKEIQRSPHWNSLEDWLSE